jgi:hypothetical protein
MWRLVLGITAVVLLAPVVADRDAKAGQQGFFSSQPVVFHHPVVFNHAAFFSGRAFFNRPFFFSRVQMGSTPIVPPFTSFTRNMTIFSRGTGRAFPVFFDNLGGFGTAAVQTDSFPGLTLIVNPAPPAPPPAAVVYNAPTVETSPAGVEVVHLMSTSLKSP